MVLLDRGWRLFGTALSFAAFGLGGVLTSLALFPGLHLLSPDRATAQRRCQYVVHLSCRLFIRLMQALGVLTWSCEGAERLRGPGGRLVLANHPSLIDVVFLIAHLPQCLCVVKKSHWRNPFVMGVVRATGYIPNDDPIRLIKSCVAAVQAGQALIIFPEGTRTVPNTPIRLKRGAAAIAVTSGQSFTPVQIACHPLTLTKHARWYQIPPSRPHFHLSIGAAVDPGPLIVAGDPLSRNNRRLNRVLQQIFERGSAMPWPRPR